MTKSTELHNLRTAVKELNAELTESLEKLQIKDPMILYNQLKELYCEYIGFRLQREASPKERNSIISIIDNETYSNGFAGLEANDAELFIIYFVSTHSSIIEDLHDFTNDLKKRYTSKLIDLIALELKSEKPQYTHIIKMVKDQLMPKHTTEITEIKEAAIAVAAAAEAAAEAAKVVAAETTAADAILAAENAALAVEAAAIAEAAAVAAAAVAAAAEAVAVAAAVEAAEAAAAEVAAAEVAAAQASAASYVAAAENAAATAGATATANAKKHALDQCSSPSDIKAPLTDCRHSATIWGRTPPPPQIQEIVYNPLGNRLDWLPPIGTGCRIPGPDLNNPCEFPSLKSSKSAIIK